MKAIAHARLLTALMAAVILAACQGNVPEPSAPASEPPAVTAVADPRDELDGLYVDTCLADGAPLPQCQCEVEAYRRHGVADDELRALLVGLGVIERTGDTMSVPNFEAFNAAAEDCRTAR